MIKFLKNTATLGVNNFILVTEALQLIGELQQYEKLISRDKTFNGKLGVISNPIAYGDSIIYFVGCGTIKLDKIRSQFTAIGGAIVNNAHKNKLSQVEIFIDHEIEKINQAAAYLAEGITMRNYKYCDLFVEKKKDNEIQLQNIIIHLEDVQTSQENFTRFESLANAVNFTRNLVSKPGNILTPEIFANLCLEELQSLGVKVTILNEVEMEKLGMGSLLAVGQGSINKPKLVVLEWFGKSDTTDVLAILGKGVTFDSGGISLKPSNNMADMKYDMSGAAVVAGVLKTIASQKYPCNLVGVLGLVENMPSGSAQRPGDVVKSMSGKTIEVENTDAEGRMVLADVLWYAQTYYNCHTVIDLATLTGAIVVALGDQFAGLFTNHDELGNQLLEAGQVVNELLWKMPVTSHYDSRINSEVADMRNTGRLSGAGATTGAQFLQRFLKNDTIKWAHLDIAGVSWTSNGELTQGLKGATGFGVRLLEEFIKRHAL
jgi:leucyl aminopeptidase